jgi:hypothetical protein
MTPDSFTPGDYTLALLELFVLCGALAFGAHSVRAWLLPGWRGSPALLVEVVIGISLLVGVAELLGLVGLFRKATLLIVGVAAGIGLGLWARGRPPEHSPSSPPSVPIDRLAVAASALVAGLLVADWSLEAIEGLRALVRFQDPLAFHLPLAANFTQTGTITTLHPNDPLQTHWFFPANAELFHAVGMVFLHRDVLTPLINFGWLAVALLAGWCIGRPYGTAPTTTIAVAVVLASIPLTSNHGTAKNDIAGIALILASAALLINAFAGRSDRPDRGQLRPVVPAGLAAGLAAGTKLPLLVPVIAIAAGLIAIAKPGSRRVTAAAWLIPSVAASGVWYLRNLLEVGNPFPWLGFGIGPFSLEATRETVEFRPPFSVAHYLPDLNIWGDWFIPGLRNAFGDLWFVILGIALIGIFLSLLRGTPVVRVLAASAVVMAVGYVFTPATAAGPEGQPSSFTFQLRFVAISIVLGLALLATIPARSGVTRRLLPTALGAGFLVALDPQLTENSSVSSLALLIGAGAVVLSCGAIWIARQAPRPYLAFYVWALLLGGLVAYWSPADTYLTRGYLRFPINSQLRSTFVWAYGQSHARIAVGGTLGGFLKYGFYGEDLSNRVRYVAEEGPRGEYIPIETCQRWRRALNAGDYQYLVTTPTLGRREYFDFDFLTFSPEDSWTRSDAAAHLIGRDGSVAVYRLSGKLNPRRCGKPPLTFKGLAPGLTRKPAQQ